MACKCRTDLIYHVDEGLGLVPTTNAADDVRLVPIREDSIYQGGEIRLTKCTSDQKSKGWSVKVGRDELGSNQRSVQD